MATNRYYSKTKLAAAQLVLNSLRHRYVTDKFFLAPSSITHPEVF